MYSQQTLPYDVQSVNRATFLDGLPNSLVPQPVNGFPQTMGQFQGPLQGMLRYVLQANCERNVLRRFNYNMLSYNNFCNEEWWKLVVNAGETLEYYYSIGQVNNNNIMGALQKIAEDVVSISVAYSVVKFPAIVNCLQPQEAQAAQQLLQKSAMLDAEILAMQQRKQGSFYNNNLIPQRQPGYNQQLSGGTSPALLAQQSPSVNGQFAGGTQQITHAQQARAISLQNNQSQAAPVGERRAFNFKNKKQAQQPVAGFPGGVMEESTPSGTISNTISQIPHFPDIEGIDITSTENSMQTMDYATLEADPVQRARALAASDALANEGAIIPLYHLVKNEKIEATEGGEETEVTVIERKLENFDVIIVDKTITATAGNLPTSVMCEIAEVASSTHDQTAIDNAQILVRAKLERLAVSRFQDVEKTIAGITEYNKFIREMDSIEQLLQIPNFINVATVGTAVCHMFNSRLKMEINGILHNSLLLPENRCIDIFPDDLGEMVKWLRNSQPDILAFLNKSIDLVKAKLIFTEEKIVDAGPGGKYTLPCIYSYESVNALLIPLDIDALDIVIRNCYYKGLGNNQSMQLIVTLTDTPQFMLLVHKLLSLAKKQEWGPTRWRIYLSSGQCIVFEKPWITDTPTKMRIWIS